LEKTVPQQPPVRTGALPRGPWILAGAGLILFHLAWLWQGDAASFWLPGLGLGIVLFAWLGWQVLPLLAVDLFLVRWLTRGDSGVPLALADTLLHASQIALSWWLYHQVARGSRWLDDPRSVTIFLILVPGGLSALAACLQAFLWRTTTEIQTPLWMLATEFWLSRMLGCLVVVPFLIVVGTPILLRYRLVDLELPPAFFGERDGGDSRVGDRIELAGLTFATSVLALLLLWTHLQGTGGNWILWASCLILILIVWTCIRQGLPGGCFSAAVTSVVVLVAAQLLDISPEKQAAMQSGIQGNLLAFCSSALLVGVSASWIRAHETRYRHVVSRIPFVVYSARLPYGIPAYVPPEPGTPTRDSKVKLHGGPTISKMANVMLVSPASKRVFGCEPETLIGPFERWLEQIVAEDRELVIASLTQLCLQKQPVTCEYRLRAPPSDGAGADQPGARATGTSVTGQRWLRDTLTPHYSENGLVDGWEGLVEDITDQRALAHNLRKMTNMLQVLITNLPTGVYFVQAPQGYPLLVNARARQLLGQREDLSAGLAHLSRVFRLHRPDGTEYPWEELPVCKALRQGVTCRANDIVVHRADGRKIPLITWAAPIDLHNTGTPDAAVWVLEDWSAMQQAELALRESELRLRAVFETMAEGVIVQDNVGVIIDCNAAACAILGIARERLISHVGLVPETVCLKEDGTAFPRAEQPDRQALASHLPARGVVLGLPADQPGARATGISIRWLLVNSLPLPVGPSAGLNPQRARVVTTFADITQQVKVRDSLRLTRDKYQKLIETLPFMLLQRDRDLKITCFNPAAEQLTGHTVEEMMQPDFCQRIIHPDDLAKYDAAAAASAHGQSTRVEARFYAKDGSLKTVLAFFYPYFNHGEVDGSTSLIVDMTTQRRLEEELLQAKHLELVGRLASGTVHDFNNLLTVLMGLAGCAKSELPDSHPAKQYLSRIEDVGEQAAHLAGQLLTFSKERPREVRAIDLNAVMTQTLKLVKSVIPAQIEVETVLDPALPTVLGDENQLKQVVMNLCLNARDAMDPGGRLTIHTDLAAPANPDGKSWVHLSIQDTGCGMPEEVRARVFEPFFSTKERGTGLGLAVVQRIIEESGGLIDVCSKPGEGTRFDVWLVRASA
jgi:PAS domain S-box-containing protein